MGKHAARESDIHICPASMGPVPHVGGPIIPSCSPNVNIGGQAAARVGDLAVCVGAGATAVISDGSGTVNINAFPAARVGDPTDHGGKIAIGCPTVNIGD